MIDFHTHLDLYTNALAILPKVNKCNLFTLAVTTSPRAWVMANKYFQPYKNIHVALGLHPENIINKQNEIDYFIKSIESTKYIGEIGIDGSSKNKHSLPKQESFFERVIAQSQKFKGKIFSIHSRGAAAKVLDILESYPNSGKYVLHWFTGTTKQLSKAIDMGCYFSAGPVMTQSKNGQQILNMIPKDRIVPESDGPFVRFNNDPIMPWDAILIKDYLCRQWQYTEKQVISVFRQNLKNIHS
ncbi:MAG: Qat anti-phage system TatD family nuclease QatD [Deferribacterales bacterium]